MMQASTPACPRHRRHFRSERNPRSCAGSPSPRPRPPGPSCAGSPSGTSGRWTSPCGPCTDGPSSCWGSAQVTGSRSTSTRATSGRTPPGARAPTPPGPALHAAPPDVLRGGVRHLPAREAPPGPGRFLHRHRPVRGRVPPPGPRGRPRPGPVRLGVLLLQAVRRPRAPGRHLHLRSAVQPTVAAGHQRCPRRRLRALRRQGAGRGAEFGYRLASERVFRRYVVKRIAIAPGEQATLETAGYRYWVSVTNDHITDAPTLESEHRHKALVEGGMRELKENFGLRVLRKHGFMANWAWLLVVATGLNLCRWTQLLGKIEPDRDLRAKRLRFRYLAVPAMLVRSGRRLMLKLAAGYPLLDRFVAALARLRALPLPAG